MQEVPVPKEAVNDVSDSLQCPPSEASDTATPSVRDNSGRFLKGTSGNPDGRVKGTKNHITQARIALEASLRDYIGNPKNNKRVLNAIDRLFSIAERGEEKVAVNAIKLLLDKVMTSPKDDGDTGHGPPSVELIIRDLSGGKIKLAEESIDGQFEEINEQHE